MTLKLCRHMLTFRDLCDISNKHLSNPYQITKAQLLLFEIGSVLAPPELLTLLKIIDHIALPLQGTGTLMKKRLHIAF